MEVLTVECKKDNKFEYGRTITHSCSSLFELERENVFYVQTMGYCDELIGQYYTICPNCGYIVMLNENVLPEEFKMDAKERNLLDPYQHKENDLISQLIHLRKRKTKVRTITLY